MMRRIRGALIVALSAMIGACEGPNGAAATPPAPAAVVDTVHPPGVSLQRFRDGLAEPANPLGNGEASLEGLAAVWAAAVATHDTATLRRLVIDRAEFAWLYYPASAFSHRPLYQPPELLWFRLQANSEKGIVRVLRRLGGSDMNVRGVECPGSPRIEGQNRIWEYCEVRREEGGAIRTDLLFGGILERAGRFKFISYANQF
jgi:hypothetical protein